MYAKHSINNVITEQLSIQDRQSCKMSTLERVNNGKQSFQNNSEESEH